MTPPDCGWGTGLLVIGFGLYLLYKQHGDTTHWD